MAEKDLIPPKMLIILELLPSCGMDFRKAALRVGYSDSYARKISSRFAFDKTLQKALRERIRRLLAEAGESDRQIVEDILQRQHFDAHPIRGTYLTGRSPFGTGLGPIDVGG
jgi:hypothetical protein